MTTLVQGCRPPPRNFSTAGPFERHMYPRIRSKQGMKRLRWGGAVAAAACLLGAPAGASASVQVGSSGWLWGNPLPQGNTLRAMDFAGPHGYARGDFGTLLKTPAGGTTMTGLPAGTFANLTELQV